MVFHFVIIKSWKLPLSTQVFTPSSPLLLHQADFVKRFRLVKERLESRESEVHGKWMTEEAMKKRQVFTDGHQEYYFLLQEVS